MPFKPGQSGNPGGKSAESEAFKRLARLESYAALELLVKTYKDESLDARVRLLAAQAVIDRAHGKPAQAIVGDQDQPLAMSIAWAAVPQVLIGD